MSASAVYAARSFDPEKDIRLLTVFSSYGSIHCHLITHKLDDKVRYTALSYTWGSPFPTTATVQSQVHHSSCVEKHVILGNTKFKVTENLHAALTSLTNMGIWGPFWIDAICINQEDEAEKAILVERMGAIYAEASDVIAWLGPESTLDSGTLQLHNDFIPALRRHLGDADFGNPAIFQQLNLDQLVQLGLLPDPKILQSYPYFRHRAYFKRAWIFQEVLLPSQLRFLYETTFIEKRDINAMSSFHLDAHPSVSQAMGKSLAPYIPIRDIEIYRQSFNLDRTVDGGNDTSDINNTRGKQIAKIPYRSSQDAIPAATLQLNNQKANDIRARTLLHFVSHLRDRQCSDQRDKVYAAIGAINRIIPPTSNADSFPVAYGSMTVQDLYIAFTAWMLERDPQMCILSFVEDPSERQFRDLPSWVPDLSVKKESTALFSQWSTFDDFEKDAGKAYLRTRKVSGRRLLTSGSCLGEVIAIDLIPVSHELSDTSCSFQGILSFCDEMNPQYFNEQSRVEALWRTLITDRDHSASSRVAGKRALSPGADMAAGFETFFISYLIQCCLNAIKEQSTDIASTKVILDAAASTMALDTSRDHHFPGLERLLGHTLQPARDFAGVLQTVQDCFTKPPEELSEITHKLKMSEDISLQYSQCLQIRGRRLYRTIQGHIGLAPCSTKVGDMVYQIQGTRLPFMLRPQKSSEEKPFSVIGEAYMHGLMDQVFKGMDEWPDHLVEEIALI